MKHIIFKIFALKLHNNYCLKQPVHGNKIKKDDVYFLTILNFKILYI